MCVTIRAYECDYGTVDQRMTEPDDKDTELALLRAEVAKLQWTFAKTLAHIPHEYVVRGKTVDAATYTRIVNAIRTYGERGTYGPYAGRYLKPGDGWKYWCIPPVINRDRVLSGSPVIRT
jgi:hypothetical protein